MSSSETPQERLEDLLKTPYPEDGEVWSAFLAAFGNELEEFEQAMTEVEESKFVGSANGAQLNKLASLFEVERPTGEVDDRFRIRVQTALRELLRDGTLDEIKDTISVLLDTDRENIVIDEPYDVEPARIDVGVYESQLEERGIDVGEFDEFVSGLTAGGVGIETFALGTFMYVSEGDDPTTEGAQRGYASLDNPDTGGTYGSLLR